VLLFFGVSNFSRAFKATLNFVLAKKVTMQSTDKYDFTKILIKILALFPSCFINGIEIEISRIKGIITKLFLKEEKKRNPGEDN
jgi:hypothetical protein